MILIIIGVVFAHRNHVVQPLLWASHSADYLFHIVNHTCLIVKNLMISTCKNAICLIALCFQSPVTPLRWTAVEMNLGNIVRVGRIAQVELKTIASGAWTHEESRYKLTRKDYLCQTKSDEMRE